MVRRVGRLEEEAATAGDWDSIGKKLGEGVEHGEMMGVPDRYCCYHLFWEKSRI